jgi:protein SMG9
LNRLQGQDFSPSKLMLLRKTLEKYFNSSSFRIGSSNATGQASDSLVSSSTKVEDLTSGRQDIFLLPLRGHDNSAKFEYGTYSCMLGMLRDQV